MFCANCGKPIADDSKFCVHCGAKIMAAEVRPEPDVSEVTKAESNVQVPPVATVAEVQPEPMPVIGPENVTDPTTLETIVGTHCDYYLPEFEKIENGTSPKFKWAAFLFGPMFCFYRKCGELFKKYFLVPYIILAVGLICCIIGALTFGIGILIVAAVLGGIYSVWLLVASILAGKNFNKDYYAHCKKEQTAVAPKCDTSIGAAIGFAAILAALTGIAIGLTLGANVLGVSRNIDDLDYDSYYEDFNDEDFYSTESFYESLLEDSVTYYMGAGTDPETPRLIIGSIDDYLYAVLKVMDQVICEGALYDSEYGDYDFYDDVNGGCLTILEMDYEAHELYVTQDGDIGIQGIDFNGYYYDYSGYQGA